MWQPLCQFRELGVRGQGPLQQQPPEDWPLPPPQQLEPPSQQLEPPPPQQLEPPEGGQQSELRCLKWWDLWRLWWLRQQPPCPPPELQQPPPPPPELQQPPELTLQQEETGGHFGGHLGGHFGGHFGAGHLGGHLGGQHLGGGWHCCWFCWQDMSAGRAGVQQLRESQTASQRPTHTEGPPPLPVLSASF